MAERIKWKQVALEAQARLEDEALDLVAAFFKGMLDSREFIVNKDSARELERQFAETTLDEFIQEMAAEIEQFEPDAGVDRFEAAKQRMQIAAGAGVLTKEFFLHKIKKGKQNLPRHKGE